MMGSQNRVGRVERSATRRVALGGGVGGLRPAYAGLHPPYTATTLFIG